METKIRNKTSKDLRLSFWEVVNEDDVNLIGVLDIKKGEVVNENIPDSNFIIEEI